ncbi:pentapeptide repeat-containing protein [Glycomyces sp. NPDC048151]|uniref:pentapeptide repeat-containing protein n=1 Tax=Glycomyces sp. NPDC048151 TaxID=3364002 RepID=UPI00371C18D3
MPPQPPPAEPAVPSKRVSMWTWTALIAVPLILAASFASYFFLAAPIPDHTAAPEAGQGTQNASAEQVAVELEIARMRAEARRNALATGAGFVAIAALILALRRQQHLERSTANAEADALRRQEHLERTATATADDALQRRITDARIRAVEQLGSDNPAVRIGGLHNLERIGQQHRELRQVVLDEVCSYLRLPHSPPGPVMRERLPARQFEPIGPPPAEPATNGADAEHEVRLIAQEILQRHLKRGDDHWEHTRLNLRNANLSGIRLSGCHLASPDFSSVTFTGYTGFEAVTFAGDANFSAAVFHDSSSFETATFTGDAEFSSAEFSRYTSFELATFTGEADFQSANFHGWAEFGAATFTALASFVAATFTGEVDFSSATFTKRALFLGTTFFSTSRFNNSTFNRPANFHGATFNDTEFESTIFTKGVSFSKATFAGATDFAGATFAHGTEDSKFTDSRIRGPLRHPSPTLLNLLKDQKVLLDMRAPHQFPDGWRLDPSTVDPRWGYVTRTDQDGPDPSD